MGEVQLATQLITLEVAAFAFMVPLGISVGRGLFLVSSPPLWLLPHLHDDSQSCFVAASIRVGNYLGANDPVRAKRVALACMVCVFVTCKSLSRFVVVCFSSHYCSVVLCAIDLHHPPLPTTCLHRR
jgi:Na+-driven multidrug efflux pump